MEHEGGLCRNKVVVVSQPLYPQGPIAPVEASNSRRAWATSDVSSSDVFTTVARQCVGETSLAAESVVQASHRYPQNVSTLTCTSVVKMILLGIPCDSPCHVIMYSESCILNRTFCIRTQPDPA